MKRIITIAILALLIAIPGTVFPQYYLGVIRGESKKIPIVVLDILNDTGNSSLRSQALDILQADLRRSEIFDVLDPKKLDLVYSEKNEPPQDILKRAGTFGATGVVWASLQRKSGELFLAGRLYDASSGTKMTGKEYFGNEETFRRMIHSFADEIVWRYTGEKGIARTRIAFVSDKTKNKELYYMDYDGQNPMKISADRSICLSPAWSPDGKFLAYVSYRDKNPDLYGLDMDTGRRWKISGSEGLNISPAWAPNGNEMAFTSSRAGTPQIYVMNADGTDVRRITFEGSYNSSPNWSPRGDRIVFASQINGRFKIATVNPDGSDFRVITDGPGSDENPSWSPSGRQIVFSSSRSGKWGIYIMNADGSDVERLTPNDANYTSPAWSP